MNILIPGGLGFVGRKLSRHLLDKGHTVTAIGLRERPTPIDHENFHYLSADTRYPGHWQETLQEMDVVVNLAGKSIFHPWTDKYKQMMIDSRVETTRHVVDALASDRKVTLVNTSAIGYYGDGGERELSESTPAGDDFLARLSVAWEAAAVSAEAKGARVIIARFGIVLDADGGAMDRMIKGFKSFLGGRLGNGQQWFSWIHMADLLDACRWVIDHAAARGVFNFCAPQPVRNADLTKALAAALNRPAIMPAPAFLIKRLMGGPGKALLQSQRVVPERLLAQGFTFQHPTIETALEDIIRRRG